MQQKSGAFTARQQETAHESAHTIRQTQQSVSAEPIITVEHLVKHYQHATTNAVNDVSFHVAPGTLFALLGPNGAGKTTTISILTTTLLTTSGTVTIAGYDVAKQASAVRDNVGIIFQRPSLDLNLTAEENVRFHAALYGLYTFRPVYALMPKEYKRHVHEFALLLDIDENLFTPVKKYSGGMKRKLEICGVCCIVQRSCFSMSQPLALILSVVIVCGNTCTEYVKRVGPPFFSRHTI